MKLMTQYDWTLVYSPESGTKIQLIQLSDNKMVGFYIANPAVNPKRVGNHMDSLTDDLCEQWFDEALSTEERKVKQKIRKEKARKEREELEARVALQAMETARLKKEEKEREKARKRKN